MLNLALALIYAFFNQKEKNCLRLAYAIFW